MKILVGLFVLAAWGAGGDTPSLPPSPATATKASKTGLNTQIYEKEDAGIGFDGVVKIIREVQGETQVFFEDKQGYFALNMSNPNAGAWQNLLTQSQKKRSKVNVLLDLQSRQILKVQSPTE